MKRFLINAAFIVIGLPYYLMGLILVIYIAIMRVLFAPIAGSTEHYEWLDRFAPFFEKDKRFILSKETITNMSSSNMKKTFLENYETSSQIVVIDDDNQVIKTIGKELENVIVFQDSELID